MNWKALFDGLPWFMMGMLVCGILTAGAANLAFKSDVCKEAKSFGVDGKLTICRYWSGR